MDDDEVLRIAILGAGPVGLEAALYGRYLGYAATLFDEREVCAALRDNEAPLSSPFRKHCTSLGLAALDAQHQAYQHPTADHILTVRQWIAEYCLPLSTTDLVANTLQIGSRVVTIEFHANDEAFELAVQTSDGSLISEVFDYLIDTRTIDAMFASMEEHSHAVANFDASETDDFFVIGSDGESWDFRRATDEIRCIYAVIGERDGLNVYASLPQYQI